LRCVKLSRKMNKGMAPSSILSGEFSSFVLEEGFKSMVLRKHTKKGCTRQGFFEADGVLGEAFFHIADRLLHALIVLMLLLFPMSFASLPAEAAPASGPPLEVAFGTGPLISSDAESAPARLPSDVSAVLLTAVSSSPDWIEVEARLVVETADGLRTGEILAEDGLFLAEGERKMLRLPAPAGGFQPGTYRVLIEIDREHFRSLGFEIVPEQEKSEAAKSDSSSDVSSASLPEVPPADSSESPAVRRSSGMNVALRALGGKVESWTSQTDDRAFAAGNLIDGRRSLTIGGDVNFCNPCGWRAGSASFPQELVFSFHRGREALVEAVVVDTASLSPMESGRPKATRFPGEIEVWVAGAERPDVFTRVAAGTLEPFAGEHTLRFSPVRARFLKLRILSTHGRASPQLAEVKILEAAESAMSIVGDFPRDIASPALGGALVWYTSDAHRHEAGRIYEPGGAGWRSADGTFPQSFVFAFNEDRTARIGSVEIDPGQDADPKSRPGTIVLSLSETSPVDGFRELVRVEFAPGDGVKTIPIGLPARFLRLDIVGNSGGKYTSLGSVRIFEDPDPSRLSVLSAYFDPEAEKSTRPSVPVERAKPTMESEPNNTPDRAEELEPGSVRSGTLEPTGDIDYYRFRLAGTESRRLHVDLSGRAAVELLDRNGTPLSLTAAARGVEPGEYLLKVFDPLSSVVLVWDVSRSMKGVLGELQRAVRGYVGLLPPGVRVNLIEFADKPRVLLHGFSSDREELLHTLDGAFKPGMGSVLYDALAEGLELLESERGNRVLVVFSDGGSEGSRTGYAALWSALRERNVRVFAIGFGASLDDENSAVGSTNERMLRHIALATGGRFLRGESDEELAALYRRIADELHGDPSYTVGVRFSGGTGRLSVIPYEDHFPEEMAPRIEIVLDASGSMNRRISGQNSPRRMDLAKQVLGEVIDSLPDSSLVALRVFGHRIREGRKGACQDTELLAPFGRLDKVKLKRTVNGIRALGTTPLAYSLRKAGEDLSPGPEERRILLITDGREECGGDPAATVGELRRSGILVRVDVVGFALDDEADRNASRRISELSGGVFFDARDRDGLKESIVRSLAPSYDVLDVTGKAVARGKVGGDALNVPEGVYRIDVRLAGELLAISDVRVDSGRSTHVRLERQGGKIVGRPVLSDR